MEEPGSEEPAEMYVFSVMPREMVDAGYRRGMVWDVEDEIDTLDLVTLEAGVAGR